MQNPLYAYWWSCGIVFARYARIALKVGGGGKAAADIKRNKPPSGAYGRNAEPQTWTRRELSASANAARA